MAVSLLPLTHLIRFLCLNFLRSSEKILFKRYTQIGQVAFVNYGRLVVIVDESTKTGLWLMHLTVMTQLNFRRLSLTDIKIDI